MKNHIENYDFDTVNEYRQLLILSINTNELVNIDKIIEMGIPKEVIVKTIIKLEYIKEEYFRIRKFLLRLVRNTLLKSNKAQIN